MIKDAALSAERWSDLISNLASLPVEQQDAICAKLRGLARASYDPTVENQIFQALQKVIIRHRNHPEAAWSLPSSRIDQLQDIAGSFETVTSSWKAKTLFDFGAVNQFDGEDWGEKHEALRGSQDETIEKVLLKNGIEAILEIAPQVDRPEALGRSLGRVRPSRSDELAMLAKGLGADQDFLRKMALGYAFGLRVNGDSEVIDVLMRGRKEGWPPAVCARFIQALSPEKRTWDVLENFDDAVKDIYWGEFHRSAGVSGTDDILYAAKQLLRSGHSHRAVDLLGIKIRGDTQIPTSVTVEVLTAAAQTKPVSGDYPQMFQYHVASLLDLLHDTDDASREELAKLEWMYLPLLHHVGNPRSPQILHQALKDDPLFFAEVVAAYVPAGTNQEDFEVTDADLTRARLAKYLLESWETVPGLKEDGSVNEEVLSDWVGKARSTLKKADRLVVCDRLIGKILRYGPKPEKGRWPAEPIRNLIEDVASGDVEAGLKTEVRTSRGTHPVSSRLEQALADKYREYAKNVRTKWPRTARMLRRIAEDFESHAERYAKQEELRGDIYG